ncbi:MAG: alpha/beta hydrolase [Proteobacteria bacterium]|nr:alpha/beta hydrolase [Pseudomonadota bacterium]
MKTNKIFIQGPSGILETVVTYPSEETVSAIGVVCHPHPLMEGTMNNKVVTTVGRAFNEMGWLSVRFNFRGVGASEGSYADGIGEVDDVLAVLKWVSTEWPGIPIYLAGFSFGSFVAYCAALQWPVKQLIVIAPPVHHFDFTNKPLPQCPWVVIQGEKDEVVPPKEVFDWIEFLEKKPQVIRFPDTGHFFHGKLVELRKELIKSFFHVSS